MDVRDLSLFVSGFLDLSLGVLIFLRNRRSQIHLSFAFFSFSLAGWALGIALFRTTTDLNLAMFWAKVYYIAASFIAASLLYFAYVFPESRVISGRRKLLIIVPALLHAVLLSFPGYLTHRVIQREWGKEVILGEWEYLFYTLYFLPFFYGALYILWSKYKRYSRFVGRQILFVLVSVLIASVFGVTFNLFLPWLGNYRLIYIGPPFTMIIFWILAYAIVRHHWLDIRLVAARTVAYSLLVVIISALYGTAALAASSVFLYQETSNKQLIIYIILTILVALSFERLRTYLEVVTDRIFFKAHYDSDQLLHELGSIMSTTIEIRPLTEEVLQVLLGTIRVTQGSFILFEANNLYDTVSVGYLDKPFYQYSQILPLLDQPGLVIFDELEEGTLKDLMRKLNLAVAICLRVKQETVGLLVLSDKASGDIYSNQDLRVLRILVPEAAVAIQNSRSYDKIKKFNVLLSQEVQKATADLRIANERLEELDELKDDFVSIASHELRTPMTAIKSYLWMALNKGRTELSPNVTRYLNSAYSAVDRLIILVNDMLNVSRIEGGRVTLEVKPVDIVSIAKQVISDLAPRFAEKGVAVMIQELPLPFVLGDKNKISEILLNLVGNALKFTPQLGSVNVYFSRRDSYLLTTVADTGRGMSLGDQENLFKKFSRSENSYMSRQEEGTGLGLYISKSLVELQKGYIRAHSAGPGKGSEFTFALPLAPSQASFRGALNS